MRGIAWANGHCGQMPNGHYVAARVRENLLGSFRMGSECGTEKGFDLILLISFGPVLILCTRRFGAANRNNKQLEKRTLNWDQASF